LPPEEVVTVLELEEVVKVTEQIVFRSKKLGCSMIILEQYAYCPFLLDF